jgi:hypothetical protein
MGGVRRKRRKEERRRQKRKKDEEGRNMGKRRNKSEKSIKRNSRCESEPANAQRRGHLTMYSLCAVRLLVVLRAARDGTAGLSWVKAQILKYISSV